MKTPDRSPSASRALKETLQELEGLEGLEQVKKEVKKFVAMLNVQRERQKHGMEIPTRSLHYVFYGNPGTGKTTVARILAKIFHGFGLLKTDKLTECSRADLVAGYAGQTAIKTKEIVESALDGVLFIDEAYMLSNSNKSDDSFGQEAIDTLLKLMEDNRERLIVIAAGYPDLMDEFLASNPGMKSRFTQFLHFEDYGVPELCHIMERISKKMEITLSPSAGARVSILLAQLYRIKDKTFGNARLVRNIFEDALSNQAVRLDALGSIPKELLTVLEGEDIPEEMSPDGGLDPANVRWKVVCPKCGKTAMVNVDLLGRPIKCRCGQKFTCPWDNPILPPPPTPRG
ncbi:MAG: AAA family ATPase [Thermoguttaceae bacterium]|nr:AAA family ATPase [Thermoguttaceae bacterium]